MINDQRTSPEAQLTLEDDSTTWKTPRKLPIILVVVFAAVAVVLLATTILFAVQKIHLESELSELKVVRDPATTTLTPKETRPAAVYPTPRVTRPAPPTTNPRVTRPAASTSTHGQTYDLCLTYQCNKSAHVALSSMNRQQNPCDNFFEYACGGWSRQQVIPESELEVTKFTELDDDLDAKLKELIERAPQASDPASYAQVRSYYAACLDLDTINSLGASPLTDVLESLGGWPVLGTNPGGNWNSVAFNFERLWANLRGQYNIDAIISASVRVDILNSNSHILEIDLPNFAVPLQFREKRKKRTFSLIPETVSEDYGRKLLLRDELEEKRAAYLQYMIDTAVALGADSTLARNDMTSVLNFEKQLANYAESAILADEDVSTTTIAGLERVYSQIEWLSFIQMVMPASVHPPVTGTDTIVNLYPYYVRHVNSWLHTQSSRVKANYLIWRLVNRMMPYLGEQFLTIHQRYVNVALGTASSPARWKDCVEQANTVFPHATGRLYVDEYFSADAKRKTTEMVANLRSALRAMMVTSHWLAAADRGKAQHKLDVMGVAVGYPDWLKENARLDALYDDLTVQSDTHFSNGLNYRRRVARTELSQLRLPVDKSLWTDSGAAVINAYYSPFDNGIIIPAAILQPPFYHPELPWYSNYGGIGVVLGHEITHGFDSKGRFFDEHGNVESWWSYSSSRNFDLQAQCMVDQYSSFVVLENNRHVDGEQTEAENIADNGGLREAYKALKDNLHGEQPRLPGLQDLTNDQMFFLSYSQVWCSVMTREGADLLVELGKHSPGRYRVIGPLQNNEAFNRAFNCPTRSYMNRHTKCKVWY